MQGDLQTQINTLKQQVEALAGEFHLNNFSGSQDFNKYSRFNTRMKVPTVASTPATCEVGELCVVSSTGKLYVCSAADTWTIVGTQS